MKLVQLFADDNEAVSPVIGVILMVAITVILAAVIGTFVLGQADQLDENAPTTQFEYDGTADGSYEVIHAGGDDFANNNVQIQFEDTQEGSGSADWGTSGDSVSAGESFDTADVEDTDHNGDGDSNADGNVASGSTIRVIWSSAEGGSSSTIGSYNVP